MNTAAFVRAFRPLPRPPGVAPRPAVFCSVLFAVTAGVAQAQYTHKVLHEFGAGSDGQQPYAGVSFDATGNRYGTTKSGGVDGIGMVWELTASGTYSDRGDFGLVGSSGENPESGVTFDGAGNLYGTTFNGGTLGNKGTIWTVTTGGTLSVLHLFEFAVNGIKPRAGVSFDAAGNLYGTTTAGAANGFGVVWKLSSGFELLHVFGAGTDGQSPQAGVSFDAAGNLYGTTSAGGANGFGMIWELTASGTYSDRWDFGAGTDGQTPDAGVSFDAAGNLYGTTTAGGAHGFGMVWKQTPSGTYSDLWDFGAGTDGKTPEAGVSFDAAGNLYGTASAGGAYGFGIVWEITPSGTYSDRWDFGAGTDGKTPEAGVTFDSLGNLYGTASAGGVHGVGMVWELTPSASIATSRDPSPAIAGGVGVSFTATVTVPGSFAGGDVSISSADGTHVQIGASNGSGAAPSYTYSGVAAGAGVLTFTITAPSDVAIDTPIILTASASGCGSSTETVTVKPFVNPTSPPLGEYAGLIFGAGNVNAGGHISGTVHVFEAPAIAQTISIVASSSDATLAAPVIVPAGKSYSNPVTFDIGGVDAAETVNVTATAPSGISSAAASFSVNAPVFRNVTFTPNPCVAGDAGAYPSVTVNLSGPVGSQTTFTLTSGNSAVAGNVLITVPAGSSVGTGTATTYSFASRNQTSVAYSTTFTATGSPVFAGRLYLNPAVISGIVVNSSPVNAGSSTTATVNVTSAMTTAQWFNLTLNTSPPTTIPVTIPATLSSTTVTVPTPYSFGNKSLTYTLSGTYNGVGAKATVGVTPNSVTGINLYCANIGAYVDPFSEMDTVQANVTLAFAAPNGASIPITSSLNGIVGPFTVSVPAGQSTGSANFTPTFTKLAAPRTMTIYAVYGTKATEVVTVYPEILSLTLQPSTIDGGQSTTATITLFDNAPPGSTVTAAVHSSTATLVGSSTIPITGNGLTYTFTVKANPRPAPAAPVPVVIQITGLGYSRTVTLTIDHS